MQGAVALQTAERLVKAGARVATRVAAARRRTQRQRRAGRSSSRRRTVELCRQDVAAWEGERRSLFAATARDEVAVPNRVVLSAHLSSTHTTSPIVIVKTTSHHLNQ